MADKNEKGKEGKKEEKIAPQPVSEKVKRTLVNWENLQNIAIFGAMILGLRQPPKAGDPSRPGEKQVPNWLLSAFPSFTDEDEVEYNICLSSHSSERAVLIAEEFEKKLREQGVFDEVKYRILLIKIRREFMEKIKNPPPEDKSKGGLTFTPLNLKDPVIEFMDRLKKETDACGNEEEIFKRQSKIAESRKLLKKISTFKKISRGIQKNKFVSFFSTITVFMLIIYALSIVFR